MIEFSLVALALCLLALCFVFFPLLQRGADSAYPEIDSREGANITLFREQLEDLDQQYRSGQLAQDQFELLRIELERRLLEESDQADAAQGQTRAKPRWLWWLLLVIPAVSLLSYSQLGAYPDWQITRALEQARAIVASGGTADEERAALLGQIERRLRDQPDHVFYLMLQGNLYQEANMPEQALFSYERLLELAPQDPMVMGMVAQTRFQLANRQLSPDTRELAEAVLAQNPNDVRMLSLLGIASFETGDYAAAIDYWQRLLPAVGPMTADGRMIAQGIAQARQRLQGTSSAAAEVSTGSEIRVAVSLAGSLSAQPEDAVFVYARAAGGPRMPLAIARLTAADLPATVTLDDSMAMAPGMNLSSFEQVEVVARISEQGLASPSSGDLEGVSQTIALAGEPVSLALVIDRRIP